MLASLSQSYDWSQILASGAIVLTFVGAVVGLVGRWAWRQLKNELHLIDHKTTPNGGNTLNLGDTAARTETKVDELRGLFLLHLTNHPGASIVPPGIPVPATRTRSDVGAGVSPTTEHP